MKTHFAIRHLFLAGSIAALLATPSAKAATYYWDVNGTAAGFSTVVGAWNGTNVFWNTDATGGSGGTTTATTLNTDDLNFVAATTNTGAITVSGAQVANSITYGSTVGAVTISGGTSITLGNGTANAGGITVNSGAGAQIISTAIALANSQTWTNSSVNTFTTNGGLNLGANTLTFSGSGNISFGTVAASVISGTGSIVMNGTGFLQLGGPATVPVHTYSGGTTITNGTVMFSGNLPASGNLTLNGGVYQEYFGGSFTRALGSGSGQVQITGGASGFSGQGGTGTTFNIGNAGATLVWGSAFFNPSTFVLQAANAGVNTNGKMSLTNGINLSGSDRIIASNQTTDGAATSGATIAGVISNSTGTAGFEKTGVGNLILGNAANTFNGALTITGGWITAGSTGALGSATNTLNFNGGTLRATGTIASPSTRGVTMTSTGIVDTNAQAVSIAGNIGGAGGLTKTGAGTFTLSGTNSYGGVTTVNAGTLAITKEVALASNTAANLNVKSGAGLALNVDSAGSAGFSVSNLDTLLGNILVANTAAQGLQAGAGITLDTSTANLGTFTQGNAITNSTGAFGGLISLTKLGAGTLILDKTNTYTGTTTISAGTVQLNDGGSISAAPLFLNGGTFASNGTGTTSMGTNTPALIGGTGGLANVGAGTLALNAPTYHTGNTAATAGNITLSHARAIQFSALDTTGAGTVTLSGTGATTPIIGGLANSGTTRNLASVIDSSYASVTNLTLNPQSGSSFTYSGVIANGLPAGMSLTKTGAGTQILTGINTYTGTTFLNGGALHVGTGSTIGKINGSTDLNFNGGTLQFNRSGITDVDAFNNSATITVNSSSTFGVTSADAGNANANETIGAVTLNAGQMNFNWTNGGSSGTQMILTSLGRSGTASANFNSGFASNNSRWKVTGAGTTTGGQIIGPWYSTGGNNVGFASTDYAVYSSDFVAQANIAASDQTTWSTAANAYTANAGASAGGSAGLTGTRTITALRSISAANAMTVDNVGNTFALTSNTFADGDAFILGGTAPTGLTSGTTYYVVGKSGNTFQVAVTPGGAAIDFSTNGTSVTATGAITLSTGNNLETYGLLNGVATTAVVLANGTGALTTPTGGGNLYVNAGAGAITISAPINNNGTVTLVKNGSNILNLSSATSTYSGGTVINAGTVEIRANTNLGVAGTGLTFNGSATLSASDQVTSGGNIDLGARTLTLNNGAIATFSTWSGNGRGNVTIGGAVTGTGGVAFNNASFWLKTALSSTSNTFSGSISVISAGDDGNSLHSINSIADGAGYGNIILSNSSIDGDVIGLDYGTGGTNGTGGGGAIAPLVLNNRQIIIATNTNNLLNNSSNQAVTINTDIGFSGTGARSMRFGAGARAGSGISTFAGKLTDNVGGAFTPTFGGGTWVLSNSNTYSGATTVSGGTLVISGINTYTGATTINGGTLSINSIADYGVSSAVGKGTSGTAIQVGGNGSAPTLIYTGAGNSTNRQIMVGYSGNGSGSSISNNGTGALIFTAATFNQNATGNFSRILTLGGTYSGSANEIQGAIINTSTAATDVLGITKFADVSTWKFSGANTYSGATTVNAGGLIGTQTSGTPFGTGAVTIGASVLSLAPTGSAADVAVAGGNVANANNFTYNADTVFSLNKGTNNSLTYTFSRTNAAVGFARGTNGTMILSVSSIGTLGNTIVSGGERFVITAAAVPVTLVNNLASAVVAQDRGNSNAGDFVTYDVADGFKAAVADLSDTFTGSNNTKYVSVTVPSTSTGGAVTAYALKVSGQTLTNTSTLTLGGSAAGVASLILNGATISGGTSLTTPTSVATELNIYTSGTSEISTPVLTATSQAGISVFGPGSLALSSGTANTFTGGLRINNSTVIATSDNQLGGTTSAITLTGGTLQTSGTFGLGGAGQRAITLAAGQDQTGGTFNVTGGTTTFQNAASGTKILSGAGSLTKTGAGTLALTGNTTNTYTGGTNVNVGTLQLGASNMLADAGAVTMSGGTLDIGGNSDTVGPVTLNSGSIDGTTGVLTGTAYDVRSGSVSAILAGAGVALTKTTSGIVTLSGANTYTGATTVNGGTLEVNGSITGSATTVANTGILKGSGSITGAVTVQSGGTLAAGSSIESLATGALTFNGGSTFAYELNNDAAPGVAGDLTAITGSFTLAAANTTNITFTELGAGSWSAGEKLTLASYSGTWNGGLFTFGSVVADDSTINFGGTDWTFNYNDASAGTNFTSDLTGTNYVTITAVPEPGAVMSLLAGLGVLALVRRRRA